MGYRYFKKCFAGIIILTLLYSTTYAALRDTTYKAAVKTAGLVTGVVVDENNRPVKGATISVKGKAISAETDATGNFSINAVVGDVLVFTYVNHYTSEIAVASNTDLKVRMLDRYLQTREQADVLYGTVNTESLLGSMATIYTNQLTTTPATIYEYALPGQMAGLYTQQSSGFTNPANQNALTSFLGSAPIVVSGHGYVPNDNTEIGIIVRGNSQEGGPTTIIDGVQENLSSIDPESIESISILKDALSTVLLGINSSKPILLVTTKKAQAGTPRISFTTQTGLQQSLGMPTDQVSAYQWAYLYNELLDNEGKPELYTTADLLAYKNHTDPYGHPDVNWEKLLLNSYSPLTSDKLNVNGGSETAKYTISLDYLDQGGIFKEAPSVDYNSNLNLSRYTLNSDIGVQVSKNLSVNLQLFGQVEQITSPGASYSNIISTIESTPNNAYPVYNPNGTFGGSSLASSFNNNLLAMSEYSGYQITKIHNILVNMDLDYDLGGVTKGLSIKVKANLASQSQILIDRSYENLAYQYNKVDSSITYSPVGTPSSISNTFSPTVTATTSFEQASLDYSRQFGKNSISAQAFYDTRSQVLTYDLAAITTDRALKAGYNYEGKYFAEGIVNYSGFNRFAPGQQNGWFWAGGLGWQMAKEDFVKDNVSWIDSWKWRATYGQTGNDNDAGYYTFKQTYGNSSAPAYYFGLGHPGAFNSDGFTETSPIANPNETWERARKFDLGADISLLKNKLRITADYYHELYYDLSVTSGGDIALLGAAYPSLNIGRRLYTGDELTITYQDHLGDFNYFISGNGTIAASKVLYFDEEKQPYPWMQQTGLPENVIFGYVAEGFVTAQDVKNKIAAPAGYTPQVGDIKYEDLNGDGVINQYDEKPIGNLKPLVYYGTTLGFNYKGFSFSAIFQGVFNRELDIDNGYVNGFSGLGFFGTGEPGQAYENILNRWTPETAATAQYPRLYFDGPNNQLFSTFYLKSGDYFRLKNAEIGYTLPASFSNRLHLAGLRVFINAENVFTIAAYREFPGMDPEVNGEGAYPIQRVLNAGLTIKL